MISIDKRELSELVAFSRTTPGQTVSRARQTVKAVSLAVEKRVKVEMPVDSGRARASWGHWKGSVRGNPDASVADAVWKEEDGGLTIEQGTNVPYVEQLNAGHSRQAPAGFVDRAGMFGQLTLEEELGMIDPLSPEYQGRLFVAQFG